MHDLQPNPMSGPSLALGLSGDAALHFESRQPASISATRGMNTDPVLQEQPVGAGAERFASTLPTRPEIAADMPRELDEMA
jgi:hypothetical protein